MSAIFTDAVLMRSLILFLLVGSVVGLFGGILLLLRPDWMLSMNKFSNRWISTRKMGRSLEKSVNIDRWFYRNSHLSGVVLLTGAIYIVYALTTQVVRADLLASFGRLHLVQPVLLEPLLDTLVLIFLAGALLAMIVSLFLIFRPSMLRDLELVANRSMSLRKSLRPMEVQRGNVDQLVFGNVRVVGVLLLCVSLYTLVVLAYWLSGQ